MRLTLRAIGRGKKTPEAALATDYAERIGAMGRQVGFASFKIIETEAPRIANAAARQREEADWLLRDIAPASVVVALDERGKAMTSQAFADWLANTRDEGAGEAVFLIGGADGHGARVRDRANHQLSFGPATWPHLLARAMACEQIYRAVTILAGHPYHRE